MKKVCEVYPDVRIKWLEDGELPMLKSQDMSLEISSVVEAIERLRGIITKQQETIERLCVLIEKNNDFLLLFCFCYDFFCTFAAYTYLHSHFFENILTCFLSPFSGAFLMNTGD